MPCWFFEKKDLKNTPSFQDGIDSDTEARYRREGAKFIVDTGTKMGLRYDTCATGVVYFNRFYLFYSFKQFHRYVTAASCLFLAGKVEETPKKCKDIIKTSQSMLSEAQMQVFGDDPKEEVITMERIILQTLRFDLQVEHPYSYLLRYAKLLKGDHAKMQKMVQMAWTFINDSLCTTLCLQYEADIIAISLLYLATRLSKIDVTDWHGRSPDFKGKWFEALVEDTSIDLLEDICHQVLDLYSVTPSKKTELSPPPPPAPTAEQQQQQQLIKQNMSSEGKALSSFGSSSVVKNVPNSPAKKVEGATNVIDSKDRDRGIKRHSDEVTPGYQSHPGGQAVGAGVAGGARTDYSSYNPFMSSQMYSSSFMSGEGAQSIQSLMGGGGGGGPQQQQAAYAQQQYASHQHQAVSYDPQQGSYAYQQQAATSAMYAGQQPLQQQYGAQYVPQQQQQQYVQQQYAQQTTQQYTHYQPAQQYPSSSYSQQQPQQPYAGGPSYTAGGQQPLGYGQPYAGGPSKHDRHEHSRPNAPGLPTVRITSRPR
jgi:hypothetical protein